MLRIKQSIYLALKNVFSTSFLMCHITFNEISATLSIQFWYKGRYTRYIRSNDMFILWIQSIRNVIPWNHVSAISIKIENYVYTFYQKSPLLFINGLIFDNMNTQINQSLEFEWKPMLASLRSVNDRRFLWLRNVFLQTFQDWLNSVQQTRKRYKRCRPENVHIVVNIWRIKNKVLIQSLKLNNFFFYIRLSKYWRNVFVKILLETGLVGKDL